jgi:hypothetical protein
VDTSDYLESFGPPQQSLNYFTGSSKFKVSGNHVLELEIVPITEESKDGEHNFINYLDEELNEDMLELPPKGNDIMHEVLNITGPLVHQ